MRKVLSSVLALAMILTMIQVGIISASAYQSGDYTYDLAGSSPNQTAIITHYTGTDDAITVPATLDGYQVKGIGDYAFSGLNDLTSVTIPDSVISFGNQVFSRSWKLNSVTFGNGVQSLGDGTFEGCEGLAIVNIGSGVVSINDDEFNECTALTQINVDSNNNTYSSQDGVLFNKAMTSLIWYPSAKPGNYIIPSTVTDIHDWAFYRCSELTGITIPDGIVTIGLHAFLYCTELTTVTIPESVTDIGVIAFAGCSKLTQINVNVNNPSYSSHDGVLFNKSGTEIIRYPGGKTGDYVIPDTVTYIGQAFAICSGLTGVIIPDSITAISEEAFIICTALTSVTMGESVTSIGEIAFYGCSALEHITIPNSVASIGNGAFSGCTNLEDVIIPNDVTVIGNETFSDCSSLSSVIIGNSVANIGDSAFQNCAELTSVIIPDSVESIGRYAFYGCEGLNDLTIGSEVENINEYAFENCTGLTSVTIPSSVTSIGGGAFHNCSGLASAYFFGDAPTTMSTYVFENCASSFKVFYIDGKTGFSDPWYGYPTYTFVPLAAPTFSSSPTVTTNGDVTVTITYPSAATTKEYRLSSGAWTSYTNPVVLSANDTVYARCFDSSGTPSYTGSIVISNIDKEAPATPTFSQSPEAPVINGNVAVTVNYPADAAVREYKIDSGSWTAYTAPFSVSENCTVYAKCQDAMNNTSNTGSAVISNIIHPADFVYTVAQGNATITDYIGAGGIVRVPDTLGGYPVTGIGDYAFGSDNYLTSVIIPDTITSFGNHVFFRSWKLDSVTFGNGVQSLSEGTFEGCDDLAIVNIGSGVNSISDDVFNECTSLNQINVDSNNNTYSSRNGVLFNKAKTALIYYPCTKSGTYSIPITVTDIHDWAFYRCSGLTGVTIPDGVVTLGLYAFLYCTELTSVTIPKSVTEVGAIAFAGCSKLTQINVDANNPSFLGDNGVLFNKSGTDIIRYPGGKMGPYSIPGTVTSIGQAFAACAGLTSVIIPDGITINEDAFIICTALTSVTIGKDVTSIGDEAFYGCTALEHITIPNSVANIGNGAFSGCTSLEDVIIPNSVTNIGNEAFSDCSSLSSVIIGNHVINIGDSAFQNCAQLTSVIIPDSVESIGRYAFYGCEGLNDLTIGSGVASISEYAFENCTSLENAYFFGDAPATMDSSVFDNCASGFKVRYIENKTGFTNPWYGYPTEPFVPLTAPTFTSSPTTPTNGDVTVTITYPSTASTMEYRLSSGLWTPYTVPVVLSANDTVYARCLDSSGTPSYIGSIVVSNITN